MNNCKLNNIEKEIKKLFCESPIPIYANEADATLNSSKISTAIVLVLVDLRYSKTFIESRE